MRRARRPPGSGSRNRGTVGTRVGRPCSARPALPGRPGSAIDSGGGRGSAPVSGTAGCTGLVAGCKAIRPGGSAGGRSRRAPGPARCRSAWTANRSSCNEMADREWPAELSVPGLSSRLGRGHPVRGRSRSRARSSAGSRPARAYDRAHPQRIEPPRGRSQPDSGPAAQPFRPRLRRMREQEVTRCFARFALCGFSSSGR